MCILFFSTCENPVPGGYKLILVNNRDEFYARPTREAYYWDDRPDIFGGLDMEKGKEYGTWLGMNKNGKIGVLLNIPGQASENQGDKLGRGPLVVNFLTGSKSGMEYLQEISAKASDYNPFNMVTIELNTSGVEITHYDNLESKEPQKFPSGEFGFGNSPIHSPWQKVIHGKKKFSDIISKYPNTNSADDLIKELLAFLNDETSYLPDAQLECQMKDHPEYVDKYSALHVKIGSVFYGTRTNTIILVDAANNVTFVERTMKSVDEIENPIWVTKKYTPFQLEP